MKNQSDPESVSVKPVNPKRPKATQNDPKRPKATQSDPGRPWARPKATLCGAPAIQSDPGRPCARPKGTLCGGPKRPQGRFVRRSPPPPRELGRSLGDPGRLQQAFDDDDLTFSGSSEGELDPASFDVLPSPAAFGVLRRSASTTVLDIAPPWRPDPGRHDRFRDILLNRRNSVGRAQSSTRSTRSEVLWADGRRPGELQGSESGSGVSSEDVGDSFNDDMVLPEAEVVPKKKTAVRRKGLFPVQQVELACGREARREAGGTEKLVDARVKLVQTESDGELQKRNLTGNQKCTKVSL